MGMWISTLIRPFATVPFWTPRQGRGPTGTASADLPPGVELLLAIGNPRDRLIVRLLVGLALLLLHRLLRFGLDVRIRHGPRSTTALLGIGREREHRDDHCDREGPHFSVSPIRNLHGKHYHWNGGREKR